MSLQICGTTIMLTRGDTLDAQVEIKTAEGEPYVPEAGDKIRFALKRNKIKSNKMGFVDNEPLILKDIPTDTLMLVIRPEDTKDLAFGEYAYDIELTHADGDVDTFISDASFQVMREVH